MNQTEAIQALGALAHDHRLCVFRLLVKAGSKGIAAGEIARQIGITPAALSFHLKELDHAGLVHPTRDGRFIRYAANFSRMQALLTFLTEDCCAGEDVAGENMGCVTSDIANDLSCKAPTSTRPKMTAKAAPPEKTKPKRQPQTKARNAVQAGK